MMKKLMMTWLFSLLFLSLCLPLAQADGERSVPPQEVVDHIATHYASYDLEDYILINGTPSGDYAFVMVKQGTARVLLGYHLENGKMKYWLKSANAVPQGAPNAYFMRHSRGLHISAGNSDKVYTDDLGFTISRLEPKAEEFVQQRVAYHWEKGGFKLFSYMDRDIYWCDAYVQEDKVSFYDLAYGLNLGRVYGVLQRELRYVNFAALPKTYEAARKSLTLAPEIPAGELSANKIKFTGGQKFPVYSGPGTHYLRAANDKAMVSTNDWIQVFGQENGWILIQYDLDSQHMRMGYIEAAALPKNTRVNSLALYGQSFTLAAPVTLTDDPLFSRSALASLPQGQTVNRLSSMGSWAYVETLVNNKPARGFVPQVSLHLTTPAPTSTPSIPAGQLYNGSFGFANYEGTVTISLNADQTLYDIRVYVKEPAAWKARQEGTDYLLGYQLYQNNQASALAKTAPDMDGFTVYVLNASKAQGATTLGLVPIFSRSNVKADETITIQLP
ncbi:MAG: hypothetical protein GXZ04_07780 [Clostridiales bacterium]|nr:hypothetical protein [Clostridiales bacterium]